MARERSRSRDRDDEKPSFPFGRLEIYGNLTRDPNEMGKDGNACGFTVAANYRDSYNDQEDAFFVGVTVSGGYAQWALDNLRKGDRVLVIGPGYGNFWEEKKEHNLQINWATFVGRDERFYRADNDDDDNRGRSRSSGRGSSSRGSNRGSGGRSRSTRGRDRYDDDDDLDDNEDEDTGASRTRRPAPDRRRRRRPVAETEN